ncbi:MAG: hypothetical protein SGPRY_008609, partial [Prymnesium sp.]
MPRVPSSHKHLLPPRDASTAPPSTVCTGHMQRTTTSDARHQTFLSYEGVARESIGESHAFWEARVPLSRWAAHLANGQQTGVARGVALCEAALEADSEKTQAFGVNLVEALASALADSSRLKLAMTLLGALCYFSIRQLPREGGDLLISPVLGVISLATEKLLRSNPNGVEASLALAATVEAALSRASTKRQLPKRGLQVRPTPTKFRAHALSELADMIARFEVYDIKSASLYVACFQSVLALLTTDALISKQLSSRCIGALVVLFHRAPWRQTVASRLDPQGRFHSDETSPLIFDLTALQEATSSLTIEHLAWLRIISENFTSLLQFTTDESLLQVLLHARLCGRSVRAILSELGGIESNHPNAGIRSTDAEGIEQGVEAEVARQTTDTGSSLVSALHKLLRAHIFGAEMAKEKMSSLINFSATRAEMTLEAQSSVSEQHLLNKKLSENSKADDVLAPDGDHDDPSSKTHIELSDAGGRYVDIMREETPSGAPDSVPSHKIVRIYAHSVVADLCATRRLNPLSELP